MANAITQLLFKRTNHTTAADDEEISQAAELAWEYCNKIRHGGNPSKERSYARLKDQESKDEFDFLIGMNQFIECLVEFNVE